MAFYVLEQEGGAARVHWRVPPHFAWREGRGARRHMVCRSDCAFADAVGDFCDFEDGVDFGLDALEFAGPVESCDPLAEVIVGQRASPGTNDYTEQVDEGPCRRSAWIFEKTLNTESTGKHRVRRDNFIVSSGAW